MGLQKSSIAINRKFQLERDTEKKVTSACLVSSLPARMAFVKGLPYMVQVRR